MNYVDKDQKSGISIEVSKEIWKAYEKLKTVYDDEKMSDLLNTILSRSVLQAKFEGIENGAISTDHYYLTFDSSYFNDLCILTRLKGEEGVKESLHDGLKRESSKAFHSSK